jgi:hypothetical protein
MVYTGISIHAPTWGATVISRGKLNPNPNNLPFNSLFPEIIIY